MAAHAPYIMPDGRSLGHYLAQEREREQVRRRKAELRGKDVQWAQLQRHRANVGNDFELAELKAIEAAGMRRRRRWLNDKTLRDLAGPLSALDMESQFKPAPFGNVHPSPLTMMSSQPEAAAVWDNFRVIDPEKEARVLQRWAAHQRDSAPARRRPPAAASQASLALRRWAGVGRKARAALKRANPSSVLGLELQVLDFFEQAGPGAQMTVPLDDPFGRLLLHGIAEFYGLTSASRQQPDGGTHVVVYRRAAPAVHEGDGAGGAGVSGGGLDIGLPLRGSGGGARAAAAGSSPAAGRGGGPSSGGWTGSAGPSPARGAAVGSSPARGAGAPVGGAAGEAPALGGGGGAGTGTSGGTPGGAAAAAAGGGLSPSPSPSPGRRGVAGSSPAAARGRAVSAGAQSQSQQQAPQPQPPAAPPQPDHEVTCTDLLLAMADVGQLGLTESSLRRYVATHIHGTADSGGGHHQWQRQR